MCRKKLIYLISFVLVLSLASNAFTAEDPSLIIYYSFDDVGDIVLDQSGKGHDGVVVGDVTAEPDGKVNGAAKFEGTLGPASKSYLDLDGPSFPPEDIPTSAITLAAWIKCENTGGHHAIFNARADDPIGPDKSGWLIHPEARSNGEFRWLLRAWGMTTIFDIRAGVVPWGEWVHFTGTYDKASAKAYVYNNGEVVGQADVAKPLDIMGNWGLGARVGYNIDDARPFTGLMDEFLLYKRALSQAEIKKIMPGLEFPYAYNPDPPDGAVHEDTTWAMLSWSPGCFAASHDVYLGENLDDVKDGTGDTFRGNQTATFLLVGSPGSPYPDGLVPGTTYYWRIDEVNDLHPESPWKGDVWNFSVPPRTAYNPDPPDGAEFIDLNVELSWTKGFGAISHTVYFGENFDDVNSAAGGVPQGTTTYTPGPLELEKVYYWRVDEFDAVATYKGDVWSFTTPGAVGNPQPANGATGVQMTATLSWTPADNAASHQVYLGTDKEAVRKANTSSSEYKGTRALGSESYDPGKLAWYTSYYWRVDEVYDRDPANPVKGPLWSFTTADFITVDDFESYNDLDPTDPESNRIFSTWIDGLNEPTNGSIVGYDVPPFAEQSIVHSGKQAMPLFYDNSGTATYSEAERTFAVPQDWTEAGVATSVLYFHGTAGNTGQLYVKVNGSKVVYDGDAADIAKAQWQQWNIDLAPLGVNLQNVTKLSIGIDGSGASGKLYFDDIRLYRPTPAPEPQLYAEPAGGWTYTYTGDAAAAGADFTALDGTWSHENGSDQWDETAIGAGNPGGVSALDGYIRLQETGDPRDHGMSDPGSNRKVYFGHNTTAEGAPDNIVDAVTLSFRARIPTDGPLDDLHPDGGGEISPWPVGGDGYIIHNAGKGNFGIRDVDDKSISFSLALASDHDVLTENGLIMNNLNGASPSGDVDTGDAGTLNQLVLDPTLWHEFWITIEPDATGTGTHLVKVYTDGSLVSNDFIVTAGRGDNPYPGISFIQLGLGNTGQSGALDVDFFSYTIGVVAPTTGP